MTKLEMKTITLVIPLFNEASRIGSTLSILKKGLHLPGLKLTRIIFSNDGSTDNTVSIIKKNLKTIAKTNHVKATLVSYSKNRGRGFAVRNACLKADTDYIVYTDADFSIPLTNLKQCLPYINKNYDLIFGSKKKNGATELVRRSFLRRFIGYGHSLVVSSILGIFAWDYQGGFKVFSKKFVKEVFPLLTIDHWGFDIEVVYLAKKLGFKNIEIPVIWAHVDRDSKVKILRDIRQAFVDAFFIKSNWFAGVYSPKLSLPAQMLN